MRRFTLETSLNLHSIYTKPALNPLAAHYYLFLNEELRCNVSS